jgi:hypothetical protein
VDTVLKEGQIARATSLVEIALSEIVKMRDSGNIRELLQILTAMHGPLRESIPCGLKHFTSPDFPDLIDWLFSQSSEISTATCTILIELLRAKLDGLAATLVEGPLITRVTAAIESSDDKLSTAAVNLIGVICCRNDMDLSFLFPVIAKRYSLSTARAIGRFLMRQWPFLVEDPAFFPFLREFRDCVNLDAAASMRWGLQRAVESGNEIVIEELTKQDWLSYFVRIMHGRSLVAEQLQGFLIGRLLIPYLDPGQIREITDLNLIASHLRGTASMVFHPELLGFLTRLIAHLPNAIEDILDPQLGIMNSVLRLLEEGRFATREQALDVVVAIIGRMSQSQLRIIGAERLVSVLLPVMSDLSEEKRTSVVVCLRQITAALAEQGHMEEIAHLFESYDGGVAMEAVLDSRDPCTGSFLLESLPIETRVDYIGFQNGLTGW